MNDTSSEHPASSGGDPGHSLADAGHAESAQAKPPSDPTQPGHPDHELYLLIKSKVGELDEDCGRTWDHSSRNLTAGLLLYFKAQIAQERMRDLKHLVLSRGKRRDDDDGEYVILVDGDLDDPANRLMALSTDLLVRQPEHVSFARLAELERLGEAERAEVRARVLAEFEQETQDRLTTQGRQQSYDAMM